MTQLNLNQLEIKIQLKLPLMAVKGLRGCNEIVIAAKIAQFKSQCDQVKQILDQQRSQPIKRPDPALVDKYLRRILNRLVPNTTWLEPWTALWDLYDQPEQYLLNDDGVLTTVKIRWWDLYITALEDDFVELRKSLELGQDCGRRQVVKLG